MTPQLSKTTIALGMQSLLAIGMLVFRFGFSESITFHATFISNEGNFLFLAWNLFLAWIPLIISQSVHGKKNRVSVLLILLWLLFFPNAPYIITDIIHLKTRPPVPIWYDAMMLFTFAFTALLLGYTSLEYVRRHINQSISNRAGWFFTLIALIASSLGIYLGRFLRWNSWDVFFQPLDIIRSITHFNISLIGVMSLFTLLLGAGYYTFTCIISPFTYTQIQNNQHD